MRGGASASSGAGLSAYLEFVQDRSFASVVETQNQNAHLPVQARGAQLKSFSSLCLQTGKRWGVSRVGRESLHSPLSSRTVPADEGGADAKRVRAT